MGRQSSQDAVCAASSVPFMPGLFKATPHGAALLAGRCTGCGSYSFPRRSVCARCGPIAAIETATVEGIGRVYSSTVVRVPSPAGLNPPYAYGYVDMDEMPLRIFALFAAADRRGIPPGTVVRLIVEALPLEAGKPPILAYKATHATVAP